MGYSREVYDAVRARLERRRMHAAAQAAALQEQMTARYPNALSDARYGAWFAGYVSDAYRQTNQDLIDRIDALGASVDEAAVQHLCEIFEKCCRFDLRFWDMVYTMGQQCAPLCSGEA